MDEYELNLTTEHRKAIDDFLAEVRIEALKIDPATAEVAMSRGFLTDPYGIYGYPENLDYTFVKICYARNPGSDIWVSFEDLPGETVEKLMKRRPKRSWPGSRSGDRAGSKKALRSLCRFLPKPPELDLLSTGMMTSRFDPGDLSAFQISQAARENRLARQPFGAVMSSRRDDSTQSATRFGIESARRPDLALRLGNCAASLHSRGRTRWRRISREDAELALTRRPFEQVAG
jgi:hypothetical protein